MISGVWNVCGRERWDFQGSQTCSCSQWCFKGSRWRLQLHLWGGTLQTLWRFGGLVRVHRKKKPFTSNFNSILIETVWVYVTQMSFNHPVLRHITCCRKNITSDPTDSDSCSDNQLCLEVERKTHQYETLHLPTHPSVIWRLLRTKNKQTEAARFHSVY